jgi:hypothetical protein
MMHDSLWNFDTLQRHSILYRNRHLLENNSESPDFGSIKVGKNLPTLECRPRFRGLILPRLADVISDIPTNEKVASCEKIH